MGISVFAGRADFLLFGGVAASWLLARKDIDYKSRLQLPIPRKWLGTR